MLGYGNFSYQQRSEDSNGDKNEMSRLLYRHIYIYIYQYSHPGSIKIAYVHHSTLYDKFSHIIF